MCLLQCLYGDCVCLNWCMRVWERVCLSGGCVVFVCVSGHVCLVIVCVCVNVCMLVNACACMVVAFGCVCVCLAMCVW